jgi:hypothetical protein
MSTKNKTKQSDTGCGSQCVCLELTHATAQEVCIAGSFNDWHPSVTPMIRLSDGKWAKELALPPGRHEYRFVVDGEWVDDPAATELILNAFGTANAVLEVRPAAPARAGAAARADIPPKKTTGNLSPPSRATAQRGVSTSVAAASR